MPFDDDYGQKTVSVLVDNIETDLEIIDHPACEMSTEAFCATYNIDLFVVVYSVVDRGTYKFAEKVLQYLKENDMLLTRGAILVGNKTDLERHREVTRQLGRKVAKEIACKFIETSSGLDHNVDELLVGVVAQVKLNPQRMRLLTSQERRRLNFQSSIQNHRRMHLPTRRLVRQMSIFQADAHDDQPDGTDDDDAHHHDDNVPSTSAAAAAAANRSQQVRKANRRPLNLESILKMGESELEDEESSDTQRLHGYANGKSKFELLAAGSRQRASFSAGNHDDHRDDNDDDIDDGPSTSAAAAAALQQRNQGRHHHHHQQQQQQQQQQQHHQHHVDDDDDIDDDDDDSDDDDDNDSNKATDCNRKVVTKLTARTKMFLNSVLRFKRNLKRRQSSSCSDLFVI
ncbi:hypothetical protein ACLKA6_005784 [Drosophila palustris]